MLQAKQSKKKKKGRIRALQYPPEIDVPFRQS